MCSCGCQPDRHETIEVDGETYSLAAASEKFNIPYARLYARIVRLKWAPEKAVKESRYGL